MNYEFKSDQSEEYYRKLLLLDKVKPFLAYYQKHYIFMMGYCWDILFNDEFVHCYCLDYAEDVLEGPFPEGEPYLATSDYFSYRYVLDVLKGPFPLGETSIGENPQYAYYYAVGILKGPFPKGEAVIMKHDFYSTLYLEFLDSLDK